MQKVKIVWNGLGGELNSTVVSIDEEKNEEHKIADALIEMVRGQIVSPGDSFQIVEQE